MEVLVSVLTLLGVALLMAFISKRVPASKQLADWVVFFFLGGIYLSLFGFGQVAGLVESVPYLQWILAFPIGIFIGQRFGKFLPF